MEKTAFTICPKITTNPFFSNLKFPLQKKTLLQSLILPNCGRP
uniref:Uncharacterized protein n=1 Tax=Siphoviridae sp. ct2D011 TaxID=2825314 RepID=A0A8S5V9D4_9CAUD|nr:MAG TPA: hypothetical protein [Siphoviridae sp. ct2D011]